MRKTIPAMIRPIRRRTPRTMRTIAQTGSMPASLPEPSFPVFSPRQWKRLRGGEKERRAEEGEYLPGVEEEGEEEEEGEGEFVEEGVSVERMEGEGEGEGVA